MNVRITVAASTYPRTADLLQSFLEDVMNMGYFEDGSEWHYTATPTDIVVPANYGTPGDNLQVTFVVEIKAGKKPQ
jgi:hypothetical protein